MDIRKREFGLVDGEKVYAYTLENDHGMKLSCSNLGCLVTEISVPNKKGRFENVVLGFTSADEYIKNKTYFGALIGRVAGRIANAEFEMDGKSYTLPKNEGQNHLHGGIKGLHERIWTAEPISKKDAIGIQFSYISEDGEEGYPGNVYLKVTYVLNNDNQWIFTCEGRTDQKTLLNITNHSYFNLSGDAKNDILKHELSLKSDRFLTLDQGLLPTGEIKKVDNTVFDFRNGRKILDGKLSKDPQNILAGHGYDHPFFLTDHFNKEIVLKEYNSGRVLTIETDQPCVVVYTGNQIQGEYVTAEGVKAKKYLALCLETQGLPDAIHHPEFPSVVTSPDYPYKSKTIYSFGIEN